jgi:hypothetical protein
VASGLKVDTHPPKGPGDRGTLSVILPFFNIAGLAFRSSPAQAKALVAAQKKKAPGSSTADSLFTVANVVVYWVPGLPRSNPQWRAWTPAMSARYLGIATRCLTP